MYGYGYGYNIKSGAYAPYGYNGYKPRYLYKSIYLKKFLIF